MEENINVQIADFPMVRADGSIYVDKTAYFQRRLGCVSSSWRGRGALASR